MANLPLFELEPLDALVEPADLPASSSHAERAAAFHEANPSVYAALARMALSMRARNIKRFSMHGLFATLRFFGMQTHGDKYKLNANHSAWYARLLMANEPELAGFFEVRRSPHDRTYHERPVRGEE